MKELFDLINSKQTNTVVNIGLTIGILLWVFLIIYGQDIKAWRIKQFKEQKQKQFDPPVIVCSSCKGKGEKPTDVNKLMMEASLALFINHHLMVEKCNECIKLPDGGAYDYCDVVNDRYRVLVKEYDAAGPKISMAACKECMGMGTFSSKDLSTGKWLTQEEFNNKNKNN